MPAPRRSSSQSHKAPLEAIWPWVIRIAGLAIAFWETVVANADRPSLLVLAAAMIGLPEFIRFERDHR